MNSFNIEVMSNFPEKMNGELFHTGKICMGDFSMSFSMSLDLWNLQDYQTQWKNGLQRLKKAKSSCLVASITKVKRLGICMELWEFYKVDDRIHMTFQLLSTSLVKKVEKGMKPFYSKTCYKLVDKRIADNEGNSINEDGYKIWEQSISADDFFASVKNIITRLNIDKIKKK